MRLRAIIQEHSGLEHEHIRPEDYVRTHPCIDIVNAADAPVVTRCVCQGFITPLEKICRLIGCPLAGKRSAPVITTH